MQAYAKQERSIRVVIIAAEGDVFCAGADLNRKQEESNVPRICLLYTSDAADD